MLRNFHFKINKLGTQNDTYDGFVSIVLSGLNNLIVNFSFLSRTNITSLEIDGPKVDVICIQY